MTGKSRRIVAIGECMVEFAPTDGSVGAGQYRQSFAGDTFNMAWYLRRLLPRDFEVDYLTALGDDPMSARMRAFIADAGIGTDHIATIPGRAPGLYVISLDRGERSFSYWRGQSAARCLAADRARLDRAFRSADALVFSGITLAILPDGDRDSLLSALAAARARGARVVFDPNLRPRLWPNTETMCRWISRAAAGADLVLPSFEDESAAFGDGSPEATAARYLQDGARQVVVKNGAAEVLWQGDEGRGRYQPPAIAELVDTTAAGDSFNAAFLAAMLDGKGPEAAVYAAAAVAGRVIGKRGALVDI
ncbi:sugar kinase [Frigidibacter sp. RF13]|uniref:sugar kinase n=1 Tax=Frigidibacter sp. RF13 TaxID=2997340 RepID=UPI00226D7EE2|nr:sugar kinase [Frigidibacter sp. RF13]MCY1126669.1 sugar kinase [Frigidibacter sp. RF13]